MTSRMPPPPGRGGGHGRVGRPLPPEPKSGDGDTPPPLPSRPAPGRPPGKRNEPMSPSTTSGESTDDGEMYCEADTAIGAEQTTELELYEECAEVKQSPLPPPPQDVQETYDECDMKMAPTTTMATPAPADDQDQLYEDPAESEQQLEYEFVPEPAFKPPPLPAPATKAPLPPPLLNQQSRPLPSVPPDETADLEFEPSEYEELPQSSTPSPPPPPPPPTDSHRAPLPPPPIKKQPPPRAPMVQSPSQDEAPQLPSRPPAQAKSPGAVNMAKKMSGGAAQLGFSESQIGNAKGRLRKVSSIDQSGSFEKADDDVKTEEPESEANSVKNRILQFQATRGNKPKPSLPVKPMVKQIPGLPSKSMGPPPPPPVTGGGFSAVKKPDSPPPPVPTQMAPPPVSPVPVSTPSPMSPPAPVSTQDGGYFEDIYDDALSITTDPLSGYDWYHGDVERSPADKKLKDFKMDGSFLVRKSGKGGPSQPYTLVVIYTDHVYNLKIRVRPDTKVALGESKSDELAFSDVPELISHHRNNDVILLNSRQKQQYKTLLTKSPKL